MHAPNPHGPNPNAPWSPPSGYGHHQHGAPQGGHNPYNPPRPNAEYASGSHGDPNRIKDLENRATVWLVVGLAGFFLGFSLITGPLGWIFGAQLRAQYRAMGLEPSQNATAAWIVGIVATALSVLVVASVLFFIFAVFGAIALL